MKITLAGYMTYAVLTAAAIALAVAYILTPFVRVFATRLGIVAHPGGRRVHARPTPLLGGVGIYVGFTAAVCAVVAIYPGLKFDTPTIGILVSASLVALVGVLDDRFELPGWVQAGSIVVGGTLLTLFGVEIRHVSDPFKQGHLIWLGLWSVPVTLIWVLMVTKAVDCMDGLDGLAAGISAIAAGTLMLMAVAAGPRFATSGVMAAALLGGALGFLRFNYPPAKIFMGTIGAQFLGFALAAISVAGAFKIAALVAVAAPVLVLGVPLFDTTFVVLRRALSGKKIHEADTSHLHHRLVNRGMSHRQAVWIIYALTFVLCGTAYALFNYVR